MLPDLEPRSAAKVCLKAFATKGSGPTHLLQHLKQMHVSEWDTCCSLRDVQDRCSPQTHAKKQPTLAESFNHCVPYERKGARWTAFTGGITLHIVKDMVPVYTVEKPEVHPHAENIRPHVRATGQMQFIKKGHIFFK